MYLSCKPREGGKKEATQWTNAVAADGRNNSSKAKYKHGQDYAAR